MGPDRVNPLRKQDKTAKKRFCLAGQEYNQRKGGKGAFGEDRYHATAIESGEHFVKCMAYIAMNMVRAGIVDRPSEWADCGYPEIPHPPQRYAIINRQKLAEPAMLKDLSSLKVISIACRKIIMN